MVRDFSLPIHKIGGGDHGHVALHSIDHRDHQAGSVQSDKCVYHPQPAFADARCLILLTGTGARLTAGCHLGYGRSLRVDGIVVQMDLPDHGLVKEASHFPETATKGHEPFIVCWSAPVCSDDRRGRQKPAALKIAGHEVLCQKLVHAGAPLITGERPGVVGQESPRSSVSAG